MYVPTMLAIELIALVFLFGLGFNLWPARNEWTFKLTDSFTLRIDLGFRDIQKDKGLMGLAIYPLFIDKRRSCNEYLSGLVIYNFAFTLNLTELKKLGF